MPVNATMLIAENLAKSFPTRTGELVVLRDVTLRVAPGEAAVILGPSGCGKSTLLNILGTLEPPTTGRVHLDDVEPLTLPPRALARFRNQRVGFVFQDHHLMPQCNVIENVLLPTLVAEAPADAETRAHDLLEQMGLAERLMHRPAELSGGEKQRVALARALINQPRLLLADEPTGNLDQETAARIGGLLAELPPRKNIMLVLVTHSAALAERFPTRYELTAGRLNAKRP